MKRWRRYFALLIFALLPSLAWAETVVKADLDRDEMDPGDLVTLTVIVSTDRELEEISDPVLPDLSNFEIVKKWEQSGAQASVVMTPQGAKWQKMATRSFNFTLQPVKEGRLQVGGGQITVGGQRYVTRPLAVTVAPGASGSPRNNRGQRGGGGIQLPPGIPPGFFDDEEEDPFSALLRRQGMGNQPGFRSQPVNPNDAFFVQVEVDKTSVYQDEQVTASWYLYTRGQIRDLDTLKYPSLVGFWKEDIEIATQLNFQQEVINGVPYRKALLASFALFPIKPGTPTIDPYKVRCSLYDSVDAFGLFGGGQVRQYTKASQPIKITVKELPVEGRPADFSGAVGTWQLSSRVEDPNVVVGEPFALRLRFEGKGNSKRIDLPPLNLPEGLELYKSEKEAKFFRTGTGYVDFRVLLIPRKEGEITVPPITSSIFDPVQGKYVSIASEPIQIRARRSHQAAPVANSRLADKGKAATRPEDQEPQIDAVFTASRPWTPQQQVIFFPSLFALITLALLWHARGELGWGQRKRDLNRRLQARFRKVNERVSAGDWRGTGVEITNTVYFVLGEISGQGGANVEIEKLMLRAPPSVRRELAQPVMKLMDSFQALSFAPDEVVKSLRDPEQVKKLVTEMQALMEKAVALGLSAEQDGASASDPKAS